MSIIYCTTNAGCRLTLYIGKTYKPEFFAETDRCWFPASPPPSSDSHDSGQAVSTPASA